MDTLNTIVDSAAALSAVVDTMAAVVAAEPEAPAISDEMFKTDNLWMMIATALVFIMHLGFATVEAGLTRSKNTVNILFKNFILVPIGILTYYLMGFNLMYPGFVEGDSGFFGFAGFGIALPDGGVTSAYAYGTYTYWTDFLFQAMFAATCSTIVSGAVAERIKETSFIIFSIFYVAIAYPIAGSWKWGGGWLQMMETPFYDFAGSTLVHSVGGWGALVAVALLGPRMGKYVGSKVIPIPGHSMPLAMIGVMLLWLGWFGFNGGSVLSADPGLVSLVLVTTTLAACAGIIGAAATGYALFKTNDLSMALNGCLAGLVGITAGADKMSPLDSIIIGLVAGIIVVFAIVMFDKLKLDDPVGALSVHLVCGIWGTLAVGIFGDLAGGAQLVSQLIGIGAYAAFCIIFAGIVLFLIKITIGLRVSPEVEIEGLDTAEHNMEAYPNFIVTPADGTNM
jgi:Amt family ammonium transporter